MLSGSGEIKHQPEEAPETPAPETPVSGEAQREIEKNGINGKSFRRLDNKSQYKQAIAHCFITQVLHTKCLAVVSYAVRRHPAVTKSSSARKFLGSTKPVRILSSASRKAGFKETSWLIIQETEELKIQTKKAVCTHRKVWFQVTTKELRQSCSYFQGSLSSAPVKHMDELECEKNPKPQKTVSLCVTKFVSKFSTIYLKK